ncbi:hypothetical protein SAMN05444165_4155 [Paraburkholderia phenazinium]|jgi:hypothetical protein|uniref:Uncharacterized protein n=1 Tax=Paraburkholderia phenazinium TaxID=60549 RepID=A0A1N6KPK5_9BURK|nr:hypothetical protein SAMN05444165_4155 [Paraburkholderia phenazinium]
MSYPRIQRLQDLVIKWCAEVPANPAQPRLTQGFRPILIGWLGVLAVPRWYLALRSAITIAQ